MKRVILVFILMIVIALFAINMSPAREGFAGTDASWRDNRVKVEVDGKEVVFPDQKPYIEGGRTIVPLRFVSEALSCQVGWDHATQTATVAKTGIEIKMPVGSRQPIVNKLPRSLDMPAKLVNCRTMVSLRFVSECLGAYVEWVEAAQTVLIKTKGTYACRGYVVPVNTIARVEFEPDNNNPNRVDISLLLGLEKDLEMQYQETYNIISSKFGSKVGTEIVNYIKEKKDPFQNLKSKIWKENNQEIFIGSEAGNWDIDITIWEPGV